MKWVNYVLAALLLIGAFFLLHVIDPANSPVW